MRRRSSSRSPSARALARSADGSKVYVGGTNNDIGIYDTTTLERIGEIRLPTGGDMAAATLHVFPRG